MLGGGHWIGVGDGGDDVIVASADASLGLIATMLPAPRGDKFWLEALVIVAFGFYVAGLKDNGGIVAFDCVLQDSVCLYLGC